MVHRTLTLLAENFSRLTGWQMTMLIGGPLPSNDGAIDAYM
jgi:hypothetical protein